mgnify:CR=1 FL=1
MKFRSAVVALSLLAVLLATAAPVMAPPTPIIVPIKQAQFQCRLWNPPGWSYIYQNWATTMELTLTGKTLHSTISYAPAVTNEVGTSTVYTYNKDCDCWIQHEGTISYTSPYSGLTITEYWRGYLKFDGTPSASSFIHGVGYQWGYVYGDDPRWYYTNAVWDEKVGAWLLGFSIYLWDTGTQSYSIPFPDPFLEPVPASNYNPLGL